MCSPEKAGEDRGEVTDKKGWDAYRNDWRNFFECMLAPVAQQVEGEEPSLFFKVQRRKLLPANASLPRFESTVGLLDQQVLICVNVT